MQLIYRIILSTTALYLFVQLLLLTDRYWLIYLCKRNFNVETSNATATKIYSYNQNRNLYVAVIDGGSTGTRLHLFKYKQNFEIENEYFKEVKPGLSGFSMNPEGAANSVQELLDVALELTSPVERCHIPIILKATAGLRLLPDNQSENILKLVRDRIRKSGFFVDDNAVGVLSGVDEGVFSWVTVNLLLDRLKTVVSKNTKTPEAASGLKTVQIGDKEDLTVASLDLGGGSTQVTFHPQLLTQVSADSDRQHFFHAVNIDGKLIELYTHSYLGGGLIAARIGITKEDGLFNGKYYFSECFPDGYHLEAIDYAGRKWNIIGNASSFDGCFRAANRYIRKLNVRLISDLKNKDIYAFSYFYERANQLKLLTSFGNNRPGVISVGDYKNAAQKACSARSDQIGPEHWQPWKCLDLTFIYSLLHTGYGLGDTKSINLIKHFRNMEVSWALGASYDLIHSFQKRLHQLSALKCEEMKPLNWQTSYGFRSIGIESISVIIHSFISLISNIIS